MSISADGLPFVAIAGFALAVFLLVEWESRIRPMFIPHAEIKRMADELAEKHDERVEEMACIEEDRAWRHSQTFEQGKWRRVRKELERRFAPNQAARL